MSQSGNDEFEWVEKMKAQASSELAAMSKEISEATGQEGQNGILFPIVAFDRTNRGCYAAEVGKKDGDIIFHFYPTEPGAIFSDHFRDRLGDSFLAVFPHPEQLCWDYVDELNSWVVKAMGYASNPWVDGLINKLFEELDKRLAT